MASSDRRHGTTEPVTPDPHSIVTRLHIKDIESREVYAVQASCICGWLGSIRPVGDGDYAEFLSCCRNSEEHTAHRRDAADRRAVGDGDDHLDLSRHRATQLRGL